ncbi:hypothetical protein L6164_000563 [Bauhinia variegata]|uniref:Uncharacterized protein n=1 Tax=Bauhinia variegata TaxID=167791 RepID=A0ACB9Q6U5_BAUVA|nr:hypothetical protein L6164_000563 [Bauhinia variegata]
MEMPPYHDMPMPNDMKMKMHTSFYWGKDVIVLFSGWPGQCLGMYILALFFVFFLAMAAELLSNRPVLRRGTNPVTGGLTRAAVHAVRTSLLYLVMLAVMSFNLGIFIAAVVGHTLGFFIAKSGALADAREEHGSTDSSASKP